jgi:hypothetical protein
MVQETSNYCSSRWVRYMSIKSHIHEAYGTLRKMSFCIKGYAEIHIERSFLDNKKGIWEIIVMKIQTVSTCLGVSFTHRFLFLFFKNHQNPNFWWFFVGFQTKCHWADFDAWAMAESMLELWLRACLNFD